MHKISQTNYSKGTLAKNAENIYSQWLWHEKAKIMFSHVWKYIAQYVYDKGLEDVGVLLPWWRHLMETFSALLVPGEFPTQWPVTRRFDVFFDLLLNKRLSKQPRGWWFETPSWSLWRKCNAYACHMMAVVCVCFLRDMCCECKIHSSACAVHLDSFSGVINSLACDVSKMCN